MFLSLRDGPANANLYRRAADGTGTDTLVFDYPLAFFEAAWTRDGRWMVFRPGGTVNQIGGRDIFALRPGVDSAAIPLVASREFDEAAIALSPDGRWIAYESNETGRREVYLRPFPGVDGGKWQVSNGGGVAPLWSRDGGQLFFVTGDRRMASRSVRATPELELGEQTMLFAMSEDLYLSPAENYTPFDVTADGRFIMARRRSSGGVEQPLVVAENWVEELKQRARR
jgi:serine/threonine-protein kinase